MDKFKSKSLKHMEDPFDDFPERKESSKNKTFGRRASRKILIKSLLNDLEESFLEDPKSIYYHDLEEFTGEDTSEVGGEDNLF
jgi:hypothetical protein